MLRPANAPNEPARLRALNALGLLFTPAEERFDRITRLAAQLMHVPIALVSLVDARLQWFKSATGTRATQTPREISFCGHAILSDTMMVVRDAREDERFRDNPMVTGEPFVRFYAGQPLRAPGGAKVGTLCVIDTRPRRPTAASLAQLVDLARMVEDELRVSALSTAQRTLIAERRSLRRRSMLDPLTRMWNHGAVIEVLERELARATRQSAPVSVIMVDIDHFKRVNDTYGHLAGDTVLAGVARSLRAAVRPYDAIGRYGGEEFLVVLPNCERSAALAIAERMRASVHGHRFVAEHHRIGATLSLGLATAGPSQPLDATHVIAAADSALYLAKAAGRDRVAVAASGAGRRAREAAVVVRS